MVHRHHVLRQDRACMWRLVTKIPKNSGSTPTPCLDKAVLAQGGVGGTRIEGFASQMGARTSRKAMALECGHA